MKIKILLAAALMLIGTAAYAVCPPVDQLSCSTLCVEYQLPTQNVDGSPLTDLDNIKLYYGLNSRDYVGSVTVQDLSVTQHTTTAPDLSLLNPGGAGGFVSVFVAGTASDQDGNESVESNEVLKSVDFCDTLKPNTIIILFE